MAAKKKPVQRIGKRAAKGSGKSMLRQAGAGKRHLRAWRSTSKPMRKAIKARAKAGGFSIKQFTTGVIKRQKMRKG